MNAAGLSFIAFVFLLVIGALFGSYATREERRRSKEAKEISDREYNEQQEIHKGDC